MAVNDYIAQGLKPFNAASTIALAEDLKGARNQNALTALQLQREQDPNSVVNRARELELRQGAAQVESMEVQNAIPRLSAALEAMGAVKRTIANKGVAAGRQRMSEQLSFLQSQGILPDDFDLGVDVNELSDEDFLAEIEQAEQEISGTLSSLVPADESRTSAMIGDMRTLGYDMTPEGMKQYVEDKGLGTEGLERLLDEARLLSIVTEQQAAVAKREMEAEARASERVAQRQSVTRNLDQNQRLVDMTERLMGTFLESGSAIPGDLRRSGIAFWAGLKNLAGADTGEIEQMITDFDLQRKGLQSQVNARISSGDYSQSATQLDSIERSLANPNISPAAIIQIQGDLAQMDLDRAEALKIELPDRDEWEKKAKEWKNYAAPEPEQSPEIPKVQSEADYINVPSGSEYIAPDGSRRRKQ